MWRIQPCLGKHTRQENPYSHSILVYPFYRLAPCFVFFVFFAAHGLLPLYWKLFVTWNTSRYSIPALTLDEQRRKIKTEGGYWGFSPSGCVLSAHPRGRGGADIIIFLGRFWSLFLSPRLQYRPVCSSCETGVTPVTVPSPTGVTKWFPREHRRTTRLEPFCALSPSFCQV